MDHGTSISYTFVMLYPHDIMTFHLVGLDVFIGGNFKKDENIFNQNKRVYSHNELARLRH